MNHLDKLRAKALGGSSSLGLPDDPMAASHPILWRLCTDIEADKDHVWEPARLSIKAMPTGWMISLSHEGIAHSLDATSEHLGACLDALEAMLASSNPPWRSWGEKKPKYRKKPQAPGQGAG